MDGTSRPGALTTVTAGGYALLGLILCWSRFVGLDRSYASDELMTVRGYVRAGPHEILAGTYIPNNHELFSLLGWATSSIVGESEVALRLWSAVPFVVGVIVVTAWLHVRLGRLSGLLFLFLATASPLLLDITRQARGYGLAFLAMSVLVISALEVIRSPRTWLVATFCGAGLVGTFTLPNFGIAFLATGAVLLIRKGLRVRTAIGMAASILALEAWYAPHVDDLLERSRQQYGAPIEPAWIVTATIDQILIPGLVWIDETLMNPDLVSLAIVVALGLLIGSSPLLRSRDEALVLGAGAVATVVTLWITRTNVAPRFLSYLLVPLLMLLASGSATVLARFARTHRLSVRAMFVVITLGVVALVSAREMETITRLPRESAREAAEKIRAVAPPSVPVFAYVPYPEDLEFYLGRGVEQPRTRGEVLRACRQRGDAVFVVQPWILTPVTIPCTARPGARHYRFEQYARGGVIDVWLIPSAQG